MGGCFTWLLLLAGSVGVMVSLLRWFEQTADAVDRGGWRRLALLLAFPLAVWFFPSRVAAGRPIPVPRHQPVRGFGALPKGQMEEPRPADDDAPSPGAPSKFITPPMPPERSTKSRPPIDSEKNRQTPRANAPTGNARRRMIARRYRAYL